jgi:uncharacterized protein YcaQ
MTEHQPHQPHRLSRTEARRVAVRAQLLRKQRPTDVLGLVRHLTMLQLDPTAAIAPNADLVAWSRLGSSYAAADLVTALEKRRRVHAVHQDVAFTKTITAAVRREIDDLERWLKMDSALPD